MASTHLLTPMPGQAFLVARLPELHAPLVARQYLGPTLPGVGPNRRDVFASSIPNVFASAVALFGLTRIYPAPPSHSHAAYWLKRSAAPRDFILSSTRNGGQAPERGVLREMGAHRSNLLQRFGQVARDNRSFSSADAQV